jgi:hypothetical protein
LHWLCEGLESPFSQTARPVSVSPALANLPSTYKMAAKRETVAKKILRIIVSGKHFVKRAVFMTDFVP